MHSTMGHWIAIVVQRRNNKIVYYVMDSIGGKPTQQANALKQLIEHSNVDQLNTIADRVKLTHEVREHLAQARNNLYKGGIVRALVSPPAVLKPLTKAINAIVQQNALHEPSLAQLIKQISTDLETVGTNFKNYKPQTDELLKSLKNGTRITTKNFGSITTTLAQQHAQKRLVASQKGLLARAAGFVGTLAYRTAKATAQLVGLGHYFAPSK